MVGFIEYAVLYQLSFQPCQLRRCRSGTSFPGINPAALISRNCAQRHIVIMGNDRTPSRDEPVTRPG